MATSPSAVTLATPAPAAAGLPALWFGLFGAAAAWSVQELASYALLAHACYPSWYPLAAPVTSAAWPFAAVVSLAALLVSVAAVLTALRAWRHTRLGRAEAKAHHAEVGEGRVSFMALSGVLVSSIFLSNIVMNAIVLFVVPPCAM